MSSDEEFYDLYNQQYGLTVDEVKNLREEWFIHKPDDDVSNVENLYYLDEITIDKSPQR